jgi:hypothetical protein
MMRKKDPDETFVSAYVIRPLVWFAWQFSSEARFIRKHRKRQKEKL